MFTTLLHHILIKYLHDPATWKDLVINAFGAFIGIGGAYLLYYHQEKNKHRDKLKYFSQLLESIIPFTSKQAENCEKLSKAIRAEPLQLHLLEYEANSDLKRLSERLDQESLYHSMISVYGRNDKTVMQFKNIYGRIDFLDHSIDQLKDFLQKEFFSITEKKKQYKDYVDTIIEKLAFLTVDNRLKDEGVLIDEINNFLVNYHETRPSPEPLDFVNETLLVPVRNYLGENYPTNGITNEIVGLIKKALTKHHHILLQSSGLAEDLMVFQNDLRNQSELLKLEAEIVTRRFKLE